ncbi:DUF222 domain-containing protein [Nostocoides sp. F2B08]|uniref:HNH endonuclease signature motif containing protein n=1 Tax=Nostocoides sp. F2B08 TaxID=2653936 RepID=UPI0012635726|nr:HNH endonuclease signature motif containing protein [Tetrasphaera sp. F2B08]KAB7745278.1 DUF222 domain-containing protein [Tetrasphaera sp. F2B08]
MEMGARNSDGSVIGIEAMTADLEALRERTRAVCTRLNRTHAELVGITIDLLERSLWNEGGIRSPEHWLMVRAGVSPATARDIVRMARRSVELPEAMASLSTGSLSLDQASVLTRHLPASHSQAATALAERCTVPQLRRALSRYGFQKDVDTDSDNRDDDNTDSDETPEPRTPGEKAGPNSVREDPVLTMSTNADGIFTLRFSAPASVGALVEQAIREAKDALFAAGQTQATLADALVEVCNRSLSTLEGTSRSRKYRVNVHLDTDGGWLPGVGRLPDHMLRAATCDGTLVPVWETGGQPVNLGRSMRIVPERLRRIVIARDGGCAYPGCLSTGHVDVHHVEHWTDGGRTDLDNLVALCAFHHDSHHAGGFGIAAHPDLPGHFLFTGRGGWPLEPLHAVPNPPPPTGPPADEDDTPGDAEQDAVEPQPTWQGPTGERLDLGWIDIMPNPPPSPAA